MSKQILQVNFKYNAPFEDRVRTNTEAAQRIAQVPNLHWKIWLANEANGEAGAIYLFDSEASVQSYLPRMLAHLKDNPACSNISVKQFEVVEELTEITRGPVK